jgi:hypothetical protein
MRSCGLWRLKRTLSGMTSLLVAATLAALADGIGLAAVGHFKKSRQVVLDDKGGDQIDEA